MVSSRDKSRIRVLGAWDLRQEAESVTHKGIMHHPPTWQGQQRLDSVGILKKGFTLQEKEERRCQALGKAAEQLWSLGHWWL